MQLEDFDYPLDESHIAQQPIEPRHNARLLVLDRRTGVLQHERVTALPKLLSPGDLLVFNDTQVFPARLSASKRPTGGKVEVLLVRQASEKNSWEVLIKGHVRAGQHLAFPQGIMARILSSREGHHVVAFPPDLDVLSYAQKIGSVPLPPYIKRSPTEADRARYQTIFARHPGAIAAPTAGLHFSEDLFHSLTAAGIATAMVTLHVGPGTFKPVTTSNIRDHQMEPEWYRLAVETAEAVQATKQRGGKVIAVGSTSVRVLETAASQGVPLAAGSGETSLFIYPGYEFKIVDGMLTNFHLPKSTLLMLVCALASRERMLDAYRIAAAERYRFYSYGDAMLIL